MIDLLPLMCRISYVTEDGQRISGRYHLSHAVPAIGDRVAVFGSLSVEADDGTETVTKVGGWFEVVRREWCFASEGSMDWPVTVAHPKSGPLVDVVLRVPSPEAIGAGS